MQQIIDIGPSPLVTNIETATIENTNYRTTLWTGDNLQVTLMSIEPGHDIGLEAHKTHDQFLRIEHGNATVVMGQSVDHLQTWQAGDDDVIIIPSGTWHNLTNNGDSPLKLYSIYAPPKHPHGTVHATKEEADIVEAEERNL